MHPSTPARRRLTILWAVLQLVLPLAAALAHARQATRGADVRAHVEADGAIGCAAAHAADCATCQQLSTTTLPGERAALNLPCGPEFGGGPERERFTPNARHLSALARAPPTPA